ncbi:YigZ family protein [Pseudidiomarina gelatinasegens]|jgi:uncharacterized YigZ family protein|nr:YigZ family protein [Pseudidiomarina gelatinasegens]|tara:strand:- start:663 stop:1283 length:621 start_codon:yes stop_codon:yes gene_type:complete
MSGYLVPVGVAETEIVVKNSRFIASVRQVCSAQEHQQHIQACQQQWPAASHYCSAALWGAPNDSQKYAMSDDGEPSGTAGKPMFNVLQSSGIGEVSAVVIRYFGGTKLGTGGLQRAYSQATAEVLKVLPTQEKILRKAAQINYDYADENVISHVLQRYHAQIEQQEFAERIAAQLAVVAETALELKTEIKNATHGRVALTIINEDS